VPEDRLTTAAETSIPEGPGQHQSNLLREIVETILLTAMIFLAVNTVIGRFRIQSVSMLPNLVEGEYVIVDKVSYLLHPPERGDIIVIKRPGEPDDLIKRVIGLPGETIEIRHGQVYIDGAPLTEPYIREPIQQAMPARQVEPGHVFVMGDNRNNSKDSRSFGAVPGDEIVGRTWLIYWPPPDWQIVPHYTYAVAESR
jgi:signal peptidase I